MLRTLEMLEFAIYVAPWMLFAFICLLGMIILGARADFFKNTLIEKDKEISYLRSRIHKLQGEKIIRAANEHYMTAGKEAKK